jgi:hypothetical protein
MKIILIVIACCACASLHGQEISTVLGKGNAKVNGGYGVASQKFSSIDNQFANFIGGYGGVHFNHNWMIGAGAYTLLNGNKIHFENDPNTSRQLTYIGLITEYIHHSQRTFHLTGNLLAGTAIMGEQKKLETNGSYMLSSRGSFIIEPSLNMEVNLAKWFRVATGVSYRFVANEKSYTAPAANISLKFGKF